MLEIGLQSDTKVKMTRKAFDKLGDDIIARQTQATQCIHEAIHSYPKVPYDTGDLEASSVAKATALASFVAMDFKASGLDYLSIVDKGLGTSRKYGPRPWLDRARTIFIRKLKR
jgi:hypothetical protein